MSAILIGSAPVSWGVYEAQPSAGVNPDYRRVLNEIAMAGYAGSELGPFGYLPTGAVALEQELAQRSLQLASSYVAFPLEQPSRVEARLPLFDQVCALLAHFKVPVVMVAADATPEREAIAGSVAADGSDGWTDADWDRVRVSMTRICQIVRRYPGLRIAFHHEASSPVETPAEIGRLLRITEPELVGLCFDTGHLIYGGGDAVELAAAYANRIWYVHLKDVWPEKLTRIRRERIAAPAAWVMGIFAELGKGCVPIQQVVEQLLRDGYGGWMIVEQDIVADPHDPGAPLRSAKASRLYLQRELNL